MNADELDAEIRAKKNWIILKSRFLLLHRMNKRSGKSMVFFHDKAEDDDAE